MGNSNTSRALHVALWAIQILLGAAFIMTGMMKVTMPIDELAAKGMSFVTNFDPTTVRFIGIMELLGAVGLIAPSVLRILPILTPVAASGLSVIMVLAAQYHLTHNETAVPNIVLLALSAFVAWGRFRAVPIVRKS